MRKKIAWISFCCREWEGLENTFWAFSLSPCQQKRNLLTKKLFALWVFFFGCNFLFLFVSFPKLCCASIVLTHTGKSLSYFPTNTHRVRLNSTWCTYSVQWQDRTQTSGAGVARCSGRHNGYAVHVAYTAHPTNNTLLINFLLSSDAGTLSISTDWAYKSVPKHAGTCMQRVHVPTELPFCIPVLLVGHPVTQTSHNRSYGPRAASKFLKRCVCWSGSVQDFASQ